MPTPENRGPRRPRREEESGRPSRPARPGGSAGRTDRPAAGRGRPSDSRGERPARPGSRPAGRPAYGQSDGPSRGRPSADRGDRPSYGRGDSTGRPPAGRGRPSADRGDRPSYGRGDSAGRPPAGRGRPPAGRGRPSSDRSDRPSSGRSFRDDDRPVVPQTAAQRKADEVRYRTGGRKNDRDALPRNTQSNEVWKDEGSTRPARGRGPRREEESAPIRLERDERRASAAAMAHVEATVAGSIIAVVGERASKRLIEKLALALDAFERGRYQDAKKIIIPISRDCPGVELIHEIAGLSMYRMGQWRDAADHLEQARALTSGSTLNHPVLADCYRALMRYDKVDELWKELKDASPDPTIVAEGRIVAASALADQGDIQAAVRLMQQSKQDPAKVREHHLREWYVLADLYDRSGDVVQARTIFQRIAKSDADFTDVRDRLETLGSR
ncbi:MAG: tetratricopeptide repeat protein [Ilumatobacteraceae bacterium]